jgi:hypothetical protein
MRSRQLPARHTSPTTLSSMPELPVTPVLRHWSPEGHDAYSRRYQAWQDRFKLGLDGLKDLYASGEIDVETFETRVEALLEVLP